MTSPAGVTVRIEGIPELRAKLASLGAKAERQVVRKSIRKAAAIILKDAQRRAPSSRSGRKKGRLAKGLATSVSVSNDGEVARVGIKQRAGARHGHLVEYGTSGHVIKAKRATSMGYGGHHFGKSIRHPGSRAQPYLHPAFEANKGAAVQFFKDELKAAIAEVIAGS